MEATAPKQRINALFGKYKYPILVALVGLGLMLLPSEQEPSEPMEPPRAVERSLEEKLEALLGRIEGAGQVSVLLTEKEGSQTLYQTDSQTDADDSGSRRTDDTVLVEDENRTESGLVRQTLGPVYRGAVILCQGADDPSVKLAVVEAVRCVTGLGADQISVQKMK
jgi:stage III sporulation protein AG